MNLNEEIAENYRSAFGIKANMYEDLGRFVAQCCLLLREILILMPACLRDLYLRLPTNFTTTEDFYRENGHCFVAHYVLDTVLTSRSNAWKNEVANNSYVTFVLCCNDILRLWALNSTFFNILMTEEPTSAKNHFLTIQCSYAADFCGVDYSMISAEMREKYFRPLSYNFSAFVILRPDEGWQHVTMNDINSDAEASDSYGDSSIFSSFKTLVDSLGDGYSSARYNSQFDEII
jgi:hypothetical protein